MIKVSFFIKGCSRKKIGNAKHDLLRHFQRTGLETLYAMLLISIRTLHGYSLLENEGAYSPEYPFSSINALPKGVSNSG